MNYMDKYLAFCRKNDAWFENFKKELDIMGNELNQLKKENEESIKNHKELTNEL